MHRHRVPPIAVLLLGLLLGACTSWRPSTLSPRQLIVEERPVAIRITLADGERVVFDQPVVAADSVRSGEQCERTFTPEGRAQCRGVRAVALNDVQALDVQQPAALRTLVAITLAGVALYYGLLIAVFSTG